MEYLLFQVAKPFLEPKTANKVKFAYTDDPNTNKIMTELFDMELVESAFGGKDDADFDIMKYAERMREDDKKIPSFWKNGYLDSSPPPLVIGSPKLENSNSESDSDESDLQPNKSSSPAEEEDEDDDTSAVASLPVENSCGATEMFSDLKV